MSNIVFFIIGKWYNKAEENHGKVRMMILKEYHENGFDLYYETLETGIRIVQGSTPSGVVALPKEIDGLPIQEIGERAFSPKEEGKNPCSEIGLPDSIEQIGNGAFSGCKFLKQMQLPQGLTSVGDELFSHCDGLSKVEFGPNISSLGHYSFHNCKNLKELYLPDSVTAIGKYTFYNCTALHTLRLPAGLTELGIGAFKNCDILNTIRLGGHTFMKSIVADFSQKFTFIMEYSEAEKAVLLFPDFVYEYIENYPARQFQEVNYGSGHFYRQCISNYDIDYRRYDELFPIAVREESFEISLQIAMNRLAYPYALQEEKKEAYLDFLKEHSVQGAEIFLKAGDVVSLQKMGSWDVFTEESMDVLLEMAGAFQKAEALSYLLDYQHTHFQKKEKTFEL